MVYALFGFTLILCALFVVGIHIARQVEELRQILKARGLVDPHIIISVSDDTVIHGAQIDVGSARFAKDRQKDLFGSDKKGPILESSRIIHRGERTGEAPLIQWGERGAVLNNYIEDGEPKGIEEGKS